MGRYLDIAKRVEAKARDQFSLFTPDQEQVEFLIASVTRCQSCGEITWRCKAESGWTCNICHPEEEQ